MNVVLLDGALADDIAARRVRDAIGLIARVENWSLTQFFLPELQVAPCAGDFKCWLQRPGVCAIDGPNREVARAMAQSDLAIFLTPVTFGGYSYHLKKVLDHLIGNISPLFQFIDGEVHHKKRYPTAASLLGIGTLRTRDEHAEAVFTTLVHRNAINFHSPAWSAMFAHDGQAEAETAAALRTAVESTTRCFT